MDREDVTVTYAHPKLKVEDYWDRGVTGTGIKIGIVDDGMEDHPALPISGGYACGEHDTYLVENSHAMHCGGIAAARNIRNGSPAGIAPDAQIYSIRMYYATYTDRVRSLIEAIDYAIDMGLDILSMSIHINEHSGSQHAQTSHSGTPKHIRIELRDAFVRAYEKGIIIFVAAGNRSEESDRHSVEFLELLPKMPNVVTVGNITMLNERRKSSGTGRFVDIAGYGTFIKSTSTNGGYEVRTGTSMATPQVAGIFALYKRLFRTSGLSPQQILELMFDNCKTLPGVDLSDQGRGIPMPPERLYAYSKQRGVEDSLRFWDDYTWRPVTPYGWIDNKWTELEVGINE